MVKLKEINTKAGGMAKSAVNQLMTLRNWTIGYYIVEYEQGGKDKADYGANLLKNLEKQISEKGLNETLFRVCRQFYLWSVRELRRQIKTNLYVRAGISKKPELLIHPSIDTGLLSMTLRKFVILADDVQNCQNKHSISVVKMTKCTKSN